MTGPAARPLALLGGIAAGFLLMLWLLNDILLPFVVGMRRRLLPRSRRGAPAAARHVAHLGDHRRSTIVAVAARRRRRRWRSLPPLVRPAAVADRQGAGLHGQAGGRASSR